MKEEEQDAKEEGGGKYIGKRKQRKMRQRREIKK